MGRSLYANPDATTLRPYSGLSPRQVRLEVDKFMDTTGLHIEKDYFIKGAFLAQDPEAFEAQRDDDIKLLPQEEEDLTNKWRQYWTLWIFVGCLALGAVIHETAVDSGRRATRPF